MNYSDFHKESIENPTDFWRTQASNIDWFKFPKTILSKNEQNYDQWFEDGELNASYLAIDKHIEDGHGESIAIIYDSPVTQTIKKFTYNEVKSEVAKLAGGLKSLGLTEGDTAIVYMPMIPQALFSMLACARIGVTHSVVFGGFAPNELAIRIDDCKPKVILTASSGIEVNKLIAYKPLVDEAIELSQYKPEKVIVLNRKLGARIPFKNYDIDYGALVYGSEEADYIPLKSTHPLYILYTSGTTGKPKGIVRDTGGYLTALKFSMKYIYGMEQDEVFWAASDVGWVVGHSYITYGPLINRNTTIIFEGKPIKTPDASTFWRIIEEHKVRVLFVAPTAIRAIRQEDPNGDFIKKYDLSAFRTLFLAGERSDIATINWFTQHVPIPALDHYWQTETGWAITAPMIGLEKQNIALGAVGKPVSGYNVQILNEEGEEVGPEKEGYVVMKLPLPPGTLLDLWQDHDRFISGYLRQYEGYCLTGDGGYKDKDGNVFITGRVDDVINVAGHRLSTADMEENISSHEAVAECAVVGIHDEIKGQVPLALVVKNKNSEIENFQLEHELIQIVRDQIGAVTSFKKVIYVNKLPKTRSGKTLRKLIRTIADGEDFQVPSTIEDETVITDLIEIFKEIK